MTLKTGIWIDHKEAILVLLTDAGQALQKITLAEEKATTSDGKGRPKKYTPNDFVAEDKLERKADAALKIYYDKVLASVQGATSMLIMGPAQAKLELQKRIQAKKIKGLTVELETADKITDRQLIAKVQKHFGAAPAVKEVAPAKGPTKKAKRAANREVKQAVKKAAKKAPAKAVNAPAVKAKAATVKTKGRK